MRPKPTVAALIERNGALLLQQRAHEPFTGFWSLPGGHVDVDESLAHAVKRETQEETNLDVEPTFFGVYDEYIPAIGWHAVVTVFTCAVVAGTVQRSDESTDIRFVPFSDIISLPIAFKNAEIIQDYLSRRQH